jgi:tetratricopeptide (TPR) repeat protein
MSSWCGVWRGQGSLGTRHRANACEVLFRRELGRAPDPRVRRAAEPGELGGSPATGDRAAAVVRLRAGLTAPAAGAAEPGVACLRMACAEARAHGDQGVLARTLAELGVALVHAVRGRDEEGAALLHDALTVAERAGDRTVAAQACRDLGYVEVQAGRGASAGRWLERATALASTAGERAAVLGVRGMALSDRAHYGPAVAAVERVARDRRPVRSDPPAAWSSALLGRALLLRGDLGPASQALDRSLALVGQEGWVALLPLPEALRAEVALINGDLQRSDALLEHAFSLGCRLGDPCWEALAARGIGLVHQARGELTIALDRLRDAAQRAARVSDPYLWVHAYSLDALATVAIAAGADDAAEVVDELERIAARSDMRELIVRAALHQANLGNRAGIEAARPLADTIDSPALHAALRTMG